MLVVALRDGVGVVTAPATGPLQSAGGFCWYFPFIGIIYTPPSLRKAEEHTVLKAEEAQHMKT